MSFSKLSLVAGGVLAALSTVAFGQTTYTGSNVTGLFTLSGTENVMAISRSDAGLTPLAQVKKSSVRALTAARLNSLFTQEFPKNLPVHARSPLTLRFGMRAERFSLSAQVLAATTAINPLTVVNGGGSDFNGLTQEDQRDANGGNQFTIEPPNPSIAVSGNYVLEGVNDAIQVYDTSGKALLPAVIATNELFGLAPAYNRTTGISGPYPTDMRVFFDNDTQRWFVLQRAQDEDEYGDNLATSHIYLAVSQTADPTGTYNIYIADTTDLANVNCPCVDDYPQIGADKYGFYISSNELNSDSESFVDVALVGLSKSALAAGVTNPTAVRFILQLNSGYEFALQPASTPPGAFPFLASGGVEYLASSGAESEGGSAVAIWALSNTSSLAAGAPVVSLNEAVVQTLSYSTPQAATQEDGPRPYGDSLTPAGPLPEIDGGDTRVLSLVYSGARLYLTLSTELSDQNSTSVVGGLYAVLSPTFRSGTLNALVVNEKYLVVNGSDLLRPSVAVNPLGEGAIAATLTGPNMYPSAVYIPVTQLGTPSDVYIAGAGTAPEDGFTGYTGGEEVGIARWGDYSTAVAASDGSIWMVAEYIGNLRRTEGANWDTFVMHVAP